MSFIKIPNILFDFYEAGYERSRNAGSGHKTAKQKIKYYNLEPVDFCVYVYFLSCGGFFNQKRIIRKCKTIAAHCGIKDLKTIRASVDRLSASGLIEKRHRFNQWGHYAANGYQAISHLDGGFFMFDKDYLRHKMSVSEMCVLLYLNRCRNSEDPLFACPSISKMCFALNLSKNTVRKSIRQLIQKLFIRKEQYISSQGDFGNNRYRLYSPYERHMLLQAFRRFRKGISSVLKRFFNSRKRAAEAVRIFSSCFAWQAWQIFCLPFMSAGVGQKSPNTS